MDGASSATAAMAAGSAAEAAPKPQARAGGTAGKGAGSEEDLVPTALLSALMEDGGADGQHFVQEMNGVAMCVPYRVVAGAAPHDVAVIQRVVDAVFATVEATFSHFVAGSEVSRFNEAAVGVSVPMSAAMEEVMRDAVRMHAATEGAFDPTVGALSAHWMRHLDAHAEEPAEADAELQRVTGYVGLRNKVTIDFEAGEMTKRAPTALDLCGLAKGWAVDALLTKLRRENFYSLFVDWGGDVRIDGRHPAGRDWRCGIVQPPPLNTLFRSWSASAAPPDADADAVAYCLDLPRPTAVATSGDYRSLRKFGYHHIACPGARRPLRATAASTASVTVCHAACVMADALATQLMVLQDPDRIAAWVLGWNAAAAEGDRITDYYVYVRDGACGRLLSKKALEGGTALPGEDAAAPPPPPPLPAAAHEILRRLMRALLQPVSVLAVPDRRRTGSGGCHVVTASSGVALCRGGPATRATFYFNVMAGSLLNSILQVGAVVTVHPLRADDAGYAQRFAASEFIAYGDDPARAAPLPNATAAVAASATAEYYPPTQKGDPLGGYACIHQLAAAYPCRITMMRTAGDHTVVIAEHLHTGRLALPSTLLYGARAYWAVRQPGLFRHRVVITAAGDAAAPSHSAAAYALGVVGYDMGSLSFAPPMVAVVVPRSPLASAFLERVEGGRVAMRVHFLTASAAGEGVAGWFAKTAAVDGALQFRHYRGGAAAVAGRLGEDVTFRDAACGHIDVRVTGRADCHAANPAACCVNERATPPHDAGHTVVYGLVLGAGEGPAQGGPGLQYVTGAEGAVITSVDDTMRTFGSEAEADGGCLPLSLASPSSSSSSSASFSPAEPPPPSHPPAALPAEPAPPRRSPRGGGGSGAAGQKERKGTAGGCCLVA
eukprot:TRINITY_DN1130_c2_g1_i1.p1 TRINITY_DN1130_c2_g1~~TRINITY_DN1130_c2_g1_i1.p1  ORF type:complete len:890 (+),score=202.13 TRINITY_DN1130_c2_g1_i1:119-2788(+)